MKKTDMKNEVEKVMEKVTEVANAQMKQAQELKEDIALAVHHKQTEQKILNREVGKQIKRGFNDVKKDVDHTVEKISKTMEKAANKK